MYDWGEHDKILELLTTYKYLQHLHLDKRYLNSMTGAAILLRTVL
jgi:hypothetical protein